MGKKRIENCEEKHKIPGVASGQRKHETRRRLTSLQQLEMQLRNNAEAFNNFVEEVSRQRILASKAVKIPIPPDPSCEETIHLTQKMLDSARENVPRTVLRLLGDKLMDKFGLSYRAFVVGLLKRIWLKVHLRCLQEDAGLSDEGMAEMHPLQLLRLFDAVNNTHTRSVERTMKVMVSVFGLGSSYPKVEDIFTELEEKLVKVFAEVAPDDAAKLAHEDAMAQAMILAVQGISLATQ